MCSSKRTRCWSSLAVAAVRTMCFAVHRGVGQTRHTQVSACACTHQCVTNEHGASAWPRTHKVWEGRRVRLWVVNVVSGVQEMVDIPSCHPRDRGRLLGLGGGDVCGRGGGKLERGEQLSVIHHAIKI
jgi:hypothetical protein